MESESVALLAEECKIKTKPFPRMEMWDISTVTYALEVESLKFVFQENKLAAVTNKGTKKTKFCNNMRNFGSCRYGSNCFYAHTPEELDNVGALTKYKTTMCTQYPYCSRGRNCIFAHGADELRATSASKLNASPERFESLKTDLLVNENNFAQFTSVFAEANTHMEKAVHSIRYLRNILAHLPVSVQSKGIRQECFDCLFEVLTEAALCIAQVVGGNTFQKFEESNAKIIDHCNRAGTGRALVTVPSVTVKMSPSVNVAVVSSVNVPPADDVEPAVMSWNEEEVKSFFEQCNFPTSKLADAQLDGASLVLIFKDEEAMDLFAELDFPPILFKGRLHTEMKKLGVTRLQK
jgi:hypothetical protein